MKKSETEELIDAYVNMDFKDKIKTLFDIILFIVSAIIFIFALPFIFLFIFLFALICGIGRKYENN